MKIFFIAIILSVIASSASADQYVNGYMRKDGTYVQGHYRTNRNNYSYDNYSTRGNGNPYTGQRGYVDPYASSNQIKPIRFPRQYR